MNLWHYQWEDSIYSFPGFKNLFLGNWVNIPKPILTTTLMSIGNPNQTMQIDLQVYLSIKE